MTSKVWKISARSLPNDRENLPWTHNTFVKINGYREKISVLLRKGLGSMFSGPYPDTIFERTHKDPAITMLAFLVCPDECLYD